MSATFGVGEILPNKASRTGDGIALRSKQGKYARNRTGYESHSKKGPILQRGPVSTLHFLGHGFQPMERLA